MRVGLGGYECDCTRTGYFGANCTSRKSLSPGGPQAPVGPGGSGPLRGFVSGASGLPGLSPPAELWTRLRELLKPSPAFYHFILTHFRWFWDIVNSTFIRDTLMRLVLTGEGLKRVSGCSGTRGPPGHQQRCTVGTGLESAHQETQGGCHPIITPSPCPGEAAWPGSGGRQAGLPVCPRPCVPSHASPAVRPWPCIPSRVSPAVCRAASQLENTPRSPGQGALQQLHGKQHVEI